MRNDGDKHSLLPPWHRGYNVLKEDRVASVVKSKSTAVFFSTWKQSTKVSCFAPPSNIQSIYVFERDIICMPCLMVDRCFPLIVNLEQSRRLLETLLRYCQMSKVLLKVWSILYALLNFN